MRDRYVMLGPGEGHTELRARLGSSSARLPPEVVVATRDRISEDAALAPTVTWLAADLGRRVGLALADPRALDQRTRGDLLAAGLSFVEITVRAESLRGLARAVGGEPQLADWHGALEALAGAPGERRDASAARSFPALHVVLRQPLTRRGASRPDGYRALLRELAPRAHAIRIELWPVEGPGGILDVPSLSDVRRLLAELLEEHRGGWARGHASLGVAGGSGIPLCALSEHAALLPFFRVDVRDDGAAVQPAPTAACAGCAVAEWCSTRLWDARGRRAFHQWRDELTPFDHVPEALLFRTTVDPASGYADGARLRHAPRSEHVPFPDFAMRMADHYLWDTARARRVDVTPRDLTPATGAEPNLTVALVRLPDPAGEQEEHERHFPPLALIQLGSLLVDRGHPLVVADLATTEAGDVPSALAERLADLPNDTLVGLSLETAGALRLAGELLDGDALSRFATVVGGRAVEDGPRLLREHPGLDFVVEDEGEAPLMLLARTLAAGRSPRAVPGLCHRAAGQVIRQPAAAHDLNVMARPHLDWLEPSRYPNQYADSRVAFDGEPFLPYLFVHGCPFHCAFCGDYTGGVVRTREPSLVARDLRWMRETHGVRNFVFLNTLINSSRPYLKELLAALDEARLDIRWIDSAKAWGLDADLLGGLARVGCIGLTWGVDTASPRLSKLVHKGIDLEETGAILRAASEAGIRNVVNLIQGLPHETEGDVTATLAWVERHRSWIGAVRVMQYRFIENSPLYLFPERYDIRRRGDGGFDEQGGLSWEVKRQQIAQSYERVKRAVAELGLTAG